MFNKYYKVIQNFDGILFSAVAERKARTKYEVGKFVNAPQWLKDKGYDLLIFKNIKNAFNFACHQSMPRAFVEVWMCRANYVRNPDREMLNISSINGGKIYLGGTILEWPKGTLMAEKVKLIKLIKRYKESTKWVDLKAKVWRILKSLLMLKQRS